MNRIIMHWTAGGYAPNGTDKRHYHYIVSNSGMVVSGNHPPEANARIDKPNDGSTYAAHTRGLNTGSIGVAVAAMRGAREVPFDAGDSPITDAQVSALVDLVAKLARQYRIPVARDTILTHAEVQPTLKVRQRQKWDITWLPGMTKPSDPVAVGDMLRARIKEAMQPKAPPAREVPEPRGLFAWLLSLFGGRK